MSSVESVLSIFNDLLILVFNLTLYERLTLLKKDTPLYRRLMYGGALVIMAVYVVTAYGFHVPNVLACFLCMTVPSFILFLSLSKYKDARFIVTFCFVDTLSYVIAFCSKVAQLHEGNIGSILSFAVLLVLCVGVYLISRPYYARYRELMDRVNHGWGPMAICAVLVYVLLIFFGAYPKPIAQRLEYIPVYALLCVTVLSFYGVFIVLIKQKAKLSRANILLQQQKHWRKLAYLDELTQLANQAAYDERTAELEKEEDHRSCAVIIFDIDNLKYINDTYGHYMGNLCLKKTAEFFLLNFSEKHYEFYRIGGDEFAAIVIDEPENKIRSRVSGINRMEAGLETGCTCSCGYAIVDFTQEKAFEQAFIAADKAMYVVKSEKKESQKSSYAVDR